MFCDGCLCKLNLDFTELILHGYIYSTIIILIKPFYKVSINCVERFFYCLNVKF